MSTRLKQLLVATLAVLPPRLWPAAGYLVRALWPAFPKV
jgi:hypothetical protein